jgi:hypothetical protein
MNLRKPVLRAATAVVVMWAALALPAGALASGLGGVATTTTASNGVATTSTTTSSLTTAPPVTLPSTTSGGLSALQEIAIGIVALAVFATIIYVIRRDARVHAPRHAPREIDRERGTAAPRTERIKRSRAKAKAARRARRRSGR